MRFKQYINEEVLGKNFYKKVCEECLPFLQDTKGIAYYRGGMGPGHSGYTIYSPKKNRLPTDTPLSLHELANKYFMKMFGWSGRNGVMATPVESVAACYSSNGALTPIFIPRGEIRYIWSPHIKDMTFDIQDIDNSKEAYDDFFKSYTNENLDLNKKNEVMFLCKDYYIFEKSLGLHVLRYFNNEYKRY